MPEGIRVIVSRPSGKKRIQGVKRKVGSLHGMDHRMPASLLLAYPPSFNSFKL